MLDDRLMRSITHSDWREHEEELRFLSGRDEYHEILKTTINIIVYALFQDF